MAQFTNQATLRYNGVLTSSNVVTGEVTQVITAWKDATIDTYQVDDIVTYIISLTNAGTVNINNLTITDNLGAYIFNARTLYPLTFTNDPVLYYINGILQNDPVVTAGPPLVISGINVLAGGNTTLVYRVRVNNYAPLTAGSQITNTATITGGGLIDPVTASETINLSVDPILSITKAINPNVIVENTEVTYTFTIVNTGLDAAEASAGIVITDVFNPILSDLTVEYNGVLWPEMGNYTYNEFTGLFTTTTGSVTVPASTATQNPTTGIWTITPGVTVITITGQI